MSLTRFNRMLARNFPTVVWDAIGACESLFHTYPRADGAMKVRVVGYTAAEFMAARPPTIDRNTWVGFAGLIAADIGRGAASQVELWTSAGLCSGGVRLYRPTAAEFLSLGMTDVSVPFGDYRQPYETFGVLVPDELASRTVKDVGSLSVVLTRWNADRRILSHTVFGDGDNPLNINGFYVWDDPSEEIETRMRHWRAVKKPDRPEFRDGTYIPLDDPEEEFYALCLRAAFNANLLLTNYGCREVGPANPGHAERLKETLRKKTAPGGAKEDARRQLHRMPVVYAIDQHVEIHDRAAPSEPGDPTGRRVRCHWRRGHWASQPHGAGRGLRRRIYRKPVMVHADEFGGAAGASRVVYS